MIERTKPRWVYGRHVVEEALRSRGCRVLTLWLLDADRGKSAELLRSAKRARAKVQWVPRHELDRITDRGRHQGMAARIVDRPGQGLETFLHGLPAADKAKTVMVALDQIQDPQNFGAIARSALCLGASAILYTDRRSAPLSQAVLRASAGAAGKIPCFCAGNLAQTLRRLKEDEEFWVYGADPRGRPVWDARLNTPLVLVVGSEGKGMRPLVRSHCDALLAVPQAAAGVASLNASAAAAVLLYEASRQVKAAAGK